MKITKRLIADAILAIALGFTMAYTLTGGLIHEILGMLVLIGFLIHLIIRRSYYKGAFRSLRNGRLYGFSSRASLILNLVLIVATVVMLISSVLISHELFLFLNSAFTGYDAWRVIHIVCAVVIAIGVFIHICLHAKMFVSLVRRSSQRSGAVTLWSVFSRIAAFIVAVLLAFFSVKSISDAASVYAYAKEYAAVIISDHQSGGSSEGIVLKEEPDPDEFGPEISDVPEQDTEPVITEEPEPAEDVPTLEDYLSKIICNGCSKHCPLLTPQCGKGRIKAQNATTQYYEEYGGEYDG
ncbi:MAG: cytochrome b/b6 domain-containing protein [Lachnospiraceae bacterium]|nr:cytochrome b/b6 domain-containing protein [Lachnospiraceae bacterium]